MDLGVHSLEEERARQMIKSLVNSVGQREHCAERGNRDPVVIRCACGESEIVGREGSVSRASQAWCADCMKEDKTQAISVDTGEKRR